MPNNICQITYAKQSWLCFWSQVLPHINCGTRASYSESLGASESSFVKCTQKKDPHYKVVDGIQWANGCEAFSPSCLVMVLMEVTIVPLCPPLPSWHLGPGLCDRQEASKSSGLTCGCSGWVALSRPSDRFCVLGATLIYVDGSGSNWAASYFYFIRYFY